MNLGGLLMLVVVVFLIYLLLAAVIKSSLSFKLKVARIYESYIINWRFTADQLEALVRKKAYAISEAKPQSVLLRIYKNLEASEGKEKAEYERILVNLFRDNPYKDYKKYEQKKVMKKYYSLDYYEIEERVLKPRYDAIPKEKVDAIRSALPYLDLTSLQSISQLSYVVMNSVEVPKKLAALCSLGTKHSCSLSGDILKVLKQEAWSPFDPQDDFNEIIALTQFFL